MDQSNYKKLDLASLREACRKLSVAVLWRNGDQSADIVETLAERFLKECLFHVEYIQGQGRDPNMLTHAVTYLEHTHAIPPLGTDTEWFRSMLQCLVELAVPNTGQTEESSKILDDIAIGIEEFRSK